MGGKGAKVILRPASLVSSPTLVSPRSADRGSSRGCPGGPVLGSEAREPGTPGEQFVHGAPGWAWGSTRHLVESSGGEATESGITLRVPKGSSRMGHAAGLQRRWHQQAGILGGGELGSAEATGPWLRLITENQSGQVPDTKQGAMLQQTPLKPGVRT